MTPCQVPPVPSWALYRSSTEGGPVTPCVKVFAVNPDVLSSVSRPHVVDGKRDCSELSPESHVCAVVPPAPHKTEMIP